MKKTILLLAAFMLTFVCSAKKSVHQHLTFDNGWSFRLCTDSADVISTLRKLGVNDSPYTTTKVEARKTKVTDDTEPEQAQVTASEITRSSSQKSVGGGDFRSVQIPHDWSAELSFDPLCEGFCSSSLSCKGRICQACL